MLTTQPTKASRQAPPRRRPPWTATARVRSGAGALTFHPTGSSNTLLVCERASLRSPMTTWVGAVTDCVVPPQNPGYDDEGPPVLVLTNTGTAADARVPNNALDHVEDSNSRHTQGVNFLFAD